MESLQACLEPVLAKENCELYELEWDKSFTPPILRISIENLDGPTDLDTCARCSDAISAMLDEKDSLDTEYILEVCSPGAEKELKTPAQIERAVGSYVYVKLKDPKEGVADVTGDLLSFADGKLTIAYKIKGRPKKITVDLDNVARIRNAVKV